MAEGNMVIEKLDDVVVASVTEPSLLNELTIEGVAQQLYALVDERAIRQLVVDFSKVRVLSSRMLGSLVELHKKAEAIGGQVVLCGLSPEVEKVFKVTGLHRLLAMAPTEAKAMKLLRKR